MAAENREWGINSTSEEGLREQCLFSLKMRGLSGDLINAYKYLKGGSPEDEARPFPVVPNDRIRGNGYNLEHKEVPLDNKEKLIYFGGDRAL